MDGYEISTDQGLVWRRVRPRSPDGVALGAAQAVSFSLRRLGPALASEDGLRKIDVTAHAWLSVAGTSGEEEAGADLAQLERRMSQGRIDEATSRRTRCSDSVFKECPCGGLREERRNLSPPSSRPMNVASAPHRASAERRGLALPNLDQAGTDSRPEPRGVEPTRSPTSNVPCS